MVLIPPAYKIPTREPLPVDDLKKLNAKFATVVKGQNGFYVITDPRDMDALFKYADAKFKEIFARGAKDFAFVDDLRKVAERRNRFVLAAGVAGLDASKWSDINGGAVKANAVDLATVKKEIDKLKGVKGTNPPIQIDIGGNGRYPDALNVEVGGFRQGKPVPRLIARLTGDGSLPFGDKTVSKIIMESTLGVLSDKDFEATKKEIARIFKPGGTIYIHDAYPDDEAARKIASKRQLEIAYAIPGHPFSAPGNRVKEIMIAGKKIKVITITIGTRD